MRVNNQRCGIFNIENNNNSKTNKGLVDLGVQRCSKRLWYSRKKSKILVLVEIIICDYDDDADVMFRKIVRYPIDMADNMDHMMIQCYGYQPPYADLDKIWREGIDEKTKKDETNIGFGIPRQTPF